MDQPVFPFRIPADYPTGSTLADRFDIDYKFAKDHLHPLVEIFLPFETAWAVLAMIQLAGRHPVARISPAYWLSENFAHNLEARITFTDNMREVARLGWDPQNDPPMKEGPR
jgi:hypothetical protein